MEREHVVLGWFKLNSLAVVAGIAGGFGAIIFREMINLNRYIFFDFIKPKISQTQYGFVFIPFIGALIVGPIIYKFAHEAKGHGVPEVMDAINRKNSMIRKRVAFVKIVVSSITIGSGGSAGREGPIAQIGSSVGSGVGQVLKLQDRYVKLLTVSGLSAGIASTFNAPLGGALFGMEILLGGFEAIDAVPIILACVVGTAIATSYLGYHTAFREVDFVFRPAELPYYLVLGFICGIFAVLFVHFFYKFEDFFDKLRIPSYLKPSIGGLLTGVVGFSFVSFGIIGVGYEGIEMALFGKLTLRLLLMLFILKIVATSLTIGSGSSGGVFAPSLYIGAMLGGFLGTVFNMFDSSIRPEAYVLLGMGAFFAAVGKAPLTCMVMIPEMSGDYRMIAPLMASIILSYAVSSMFLGKSSIYTLKLERKGVYKPHPPILEEFENIKVRDIMTPNPVTVSPEMPISKVFDYIARHKKLGYPVMHGGKVVGLLSFNRIRYYNKPLENLKVKNLMLHPPTVTPETSVYEVFEKLTDKEGGRVCVVENGRLVGIVTKTDILKAYNIAKKILEDEERLSTEIRKRLKKLVGRIT